MADGSPARGTAAFAPDIRFGGFGFGVRASRNERDGPPREAARGVLRRRCSGRYGTVFGVPASKRALAGSVYVVPVTGSTHGQGFEPKKAGLPGM